MKTFTTEGQSSSVRLIEQRDLAALVDLIIAIELFPPDEIRELAEMITTYLNSEVKRQFWMVDDDAESGLSGVVYCEPEQMTQGTWNLRLIGVHRKRRGEGRGKRLLERTEAMVLQRNGRILIVETSATESFENTRAFYAKCGYTEEARIRDFYKDGDDKVVFWKALL